MRLELAADYLVMAAWLAYLKSKLLLPEQKNDDEPTGEELAAALAFRLRRLEAMREVSEKLMSRNRLGQAVFRRGAPETMSVVHTSVWSATVYDLLSAYATQRQRQSVTSVRVIRRNVWSLQEAREILVRLVGQIGEWAPITSYLQDYLREHHEVTDVLVTGGDPMVMKTKALRAYLEPLLSPEFDHVSSIRIGTKSVAYWPHRYVSDADADDLMRLFEEIVASGKHLAIMGHYNHPRELSTEVAKQAVRRIRNTGANVRMQSPLIRHVNDEANAWATLWKEGVKLGAIPYYMFVERDTGPKAYFEVPLERAWNIFHDAYKQVSGLARTVRGPSMSAFPGKVLVDGIAEVAGEKVFCLQFLQGRDKEWVRRPFFAKYDPEASWLSQLKPAFGAERFFFEDEPTPTPAGRLNVL